MTRPDTALAAPGSAPESIAVPEAALPAICVLIPVWKDQAGLTRSLEVLATDPTPFDIVVVDDGSPEAITSRLRSTVASGDEFEAVSTL